MKLTGKQRAYLKSLAAKEDAIMQIGKNELTPEITKAVSELFNNREIVKISVLKSVTEDPKVIAEALAERTRSTLVMVIGKKIILYKPDKDDPQIILPKA